MYDKRGSGDDAIGGDGELDARSDHVGRGAAVPPRAALAMSLTADVVQSIDGTPRSHPRLRSIGISLGAATPPPAPQARREAHQEGQSHLKFK